jgi:hypothetical protein
VRLISIRWISDVPSKIVKTRFMPVEELQRRWRNAPAFNPAALRAEAGDFFGEDDVVADDNP